MKPKLSIITPSFDQAAFLERTLRSVLDQGYENLEYIVVDGGSTDGSREILERYSGRLAWWVSEPDRGQTDALNKGLRRATGDIVAYINSDDHYLDGAFDAAVAAFADPAVEWAVGRCRYEDEDGRVLDVWGPRPLSKLRHRWMLGPWGVPQAATFWRRELFDRFGLFREDMHYVFDTEFGLRLVYEGVLPAAIDGELAARVLHPEAKSWDWRPFEREELRLIRLFAGKLRPGERALLALPAAYKVAAHGMGRLRRRRVAEHA